MSKAAGVGSTNTNTNNEEETNEDKNFPEIQSKLDVYGPTYTPFGLPPDYSKSMSSFLAFLDKSIEDIPKLKDFFTKYTRAFWTLDGYPLKADQINVTKDFMRGELNTKGKKICVFTGVEQGVSTDGCKLQYLPPKLRETTKMMMDVLSFVLKHKVSADLRAQMLKDEETMKLFRMCIRNLFYFFGQNQYKNPFEADPELFDSFLSRINTVFGKSILRVLCEDKTKYECGRFVDYSKCDQSGEYYVYIYKIDSEGSMNVPLSVASATANSGKTCGGRRKTRKQKRTKKYKSRVNKRK
jgi:hypothetical protein